MANSTPARPSLASLRNNSTGPRSLSYNASGYRLLWRGALELPQDYFLDGIAFISHLGAISTPGGMMGTALVSKASPTTKEKTKDPPITLGSLVASTSLSTFVSDQGQASRTSGTPSIYRSSQPKPSTTAGRRAPLLPQVIEEPCTTVTPIKQFSTIPLTSPFGFAFTTDIEISLALESLRGRPSVRLGGIVRIGKPTDQEGSGTIDGVVEGQGKVRLYTDPSCPLVHNFIKRQLIQSWSKNPNDTVDEDGRTQLGILIGLGDETLDCTNLIIYGRSSNSHIITLHVGRYVPLSSANPSTTPRAPRPDDPAPRQVPEFAMHPTQDVFSSTKKRKPIGNPDRESAITRDKRGRESIISTNSNLATGNCNSASLAVREPMKRVRSTESKKLPAIVAPVLGTTKGSRSDPVIPRREALGEETGVGLWEMEEEMPLGFEDDKPSEAGSIGMKKTLPYESDNKATIKRVAMQCLAERGVSKTDSSFKEIWNFVVRGTTFASRESVGTKVLPMREILRLVDSHLDLYLLPDKTA